MGRHCMLVSYRARTILCLKFSFEILATGQLFNYNTTLRMPSNVRLKSSSSIENVCQVRAPIQPNRPGPLEVASPPLSYINIRKNVHLYHRHRPWWTVPSPKKRRISCFFATIIATRNGTEGSNFHVGNTVGTPMFTKPSLCSSPLHRCVQWTGAQATPNLVLKCLPVSPIQSMSYGINERLLICNSMVSSAVWEKIHE